MANELDFSAAVRGISPVTGTVDESAPLDFEVAAQSGVEDTMREAVKIEPVQHARVVDLAKQTGTPQFAVQDDPDAVEAQLKSQQLDFSNITPKVTDFLQRDFNNAVIAQEDVMSGVLESIEKTFSGLGGAVGVGYSLIAKGAELRRQEASNAWIEGLVNAGGGEPQGLFKQMADTVFNYKTKEQFDAAKKEATDRVLGEIQALQKERQALTPEDLTIVQEGVRGGVESLALMAPGVLLSALSGGQAAPVLVTIGIQTYASSYGDGRAEGLAHDEASWFAAIDTAIEVGTEALPLGTLERVLTGKSTGLKKEALRFIVQEMGTEQLATALQTINSLGFGLDKELANAQGASEIFDIQLRRQAITAVATIVAGGVQISAATTVRKAVDKLTQGEKDREDKGDIEQQDIDAMNRDAADSKLRERDVESFKQFVRDADGDNNTHVFIDGVQTSLYLQSKTTEEIEADPALKALSDAAQESRATGADVAIPVDEFMGDIAGTEAATELRDHMTLSEETVSPFRQEQHKVETEAYVDSLMAVAQENVSEYVEAQEIYTQVRDQLIDTGTVSDANASAMAQIVPAWATAQAKRSGKTVKQVYTDAGLVVEGPQTGELSRLEGEQILTQSSSEEFTGALQAAQAASPNGTSVALFDQSEYDRMDVHLLDNGKAGFAVETDGTLTGVFKHPDSTIKNAMDTLVPAAIRAGAVKLDAFEGFLTEAYAKHGFVEKYRSKWDDKFAPVGWDKSKQGTPDVVYMELENGQENLHRQTNAQPVSQTGGVRPSSAGLQSEERGDGRGRTESGGTAPLAGVPQIQGATGPDAGIVAIAEKFAAANGIDFSRQSTYVEVDPTFAGRVADAYDAMEHNPTDPVVLEAYKNLIDQTTAQYNALVEAGYEFYFVDETDADYLSTPWNAMRELRADKRMGVFSTVSGFGSDGSVDTSSSPLLGDTGLSWDLHGVEQPVLANDLFRAVHDAFGHGLEGAGFRAQGEENAWQAHAKLFTGSAVAAITSETRGQNSWLNYGPQGEANQTAKVEDTVFADQKIGLMPSWTWTENVVEEPLILKQEPIVPQNGLYSGYEVRETDGEGPTGAPQQGDLFAPSEVSGEPARTQAKDTFDVKYKQVETGQLATGFDTVTTPEQVAHVVASIRKHAQETFMVVVTDDAGKILNVIRHTKGLKSESSVGPSEVIGAIASTEGAANVWFAHNHPSGNTKPSSSDYNITNQLIATAEGFDVQFKGHVVVGDGKEFSFFEPGDSSAQLLTVAAAPRKGKVSTTERVLRKRGKPIPALDSPATTKAYVESLDSDSGIILMNNQHNPVGVVALSPPEMALLRDGKQVKRILSAIDTTNAAAVITFVKNSPTVDVSNEALTNVGNYLARLSGIRHLDAIYSTQDDAGLVSVRELGIDLGSASLPFRQGARGYYDPENSIIRLTEAADLSTFLHEFAHFMYEMEARGNTDLIQSINNWYKRNAKEVAAEANTYLGKKFSELKQDDVPQGTKGTITEEDVVTYLDDKTTGDKSKDAAIRRAVHEQFARGFEVYLMEGKAPSIELRNAFRTFARWLARIYQTLRGGLNVKLDAEMRQVFDRLLATEEQIAAAESRARVEPMFTDAAMAGMTDDEFSSYQQRQEKVKDIQTETLRDQLIKALTRKTKQWWKEEKSDIVDEETTRLKGEQVYRTAARLVHIAPTGDLAQQIETAKKEIEAAEKSVKALRKESDTVGQFLAKKGGLNREAMASEGVDPAEFKNRTGGVFGKPLFPKTGGLTVDGAAELLNEAGVLQSGSANDALDLINDMLADDTRLVDSDIESEINFLDSEISQQQQQLAEDEENLRTVNIKLDHATVKEMIGEERTDRLGRKSIRVSDRLRGMTAKGQAGVHPDEAAAFFGYSSGAEMLNDLMTAPPLKETAEANAEARMIERHGDVFTDGTIEQQADDAVRNEERGKLILQELKFLSRGTNQRTLDRQTMKSISADRIGRLSFREIHPGKYRKAEIGAAQEAARMLAEGNKEGAAQAKARQALNYYLGMAATEAKSETTKIVDRMGRYNKKKVREEIQKAEGGYWDQIVKILERFEFRKSATLGSVDQVNQDINSWAKERMDMDGDGLVLHNAVLNESYITHWKNVAYSDLQGINDSVKNIEHVARYANKLTRMGEEIEYNALVEKLVSSATATGTGKFKRSASASDDIGMVQKNARWAMAQMTKIPFMMSWMDGLDRTGTWFTSFSQPMTDAYNAELELFEEVGEPVIDMIKNRSKEDRKRHNTTFFIPEIKDTANGTHTGNLKGHEIIAIALNTGNEGNLRKLLLGEQWAEQDGDEINFQNAKLQAVLSHMTVSDWAMVQKIWDQINILYPKLAEVHRRTTGLVPPKVEATPFTVGVDGGTVSMDGGYYPVKYDPARDSKAAEFEERKEAEVGSMFASNASIQASVNTGATNERTGYFAPIHLTLNVVTNHIQETIHYITHHDAVREINRLLRDPRIKKAVTEKLGPEEFAQLKPWLNDIAKDGRNAPNKSAIDAIFNKLRLGTTLGVMGFKASTGIIQVSGLSNTIAEVGIGPVYQSMRTILGSIDSMKSAWAFAIDNSKVLKHRTRTMDREMMNAMQQLESKRGPIAAVQEASMKHIAYIQTYMVDLPSWHAAYIKELGDTGDEVKAFQYADWVIENVQGSGATKDMAALMRNQSKTHTIFTMFMTFFSSLWNMERDLVKGHRSGKYSTTTVAAKTMFLITIPVIFEMMMRGEFSQEDGDDEDRLQKMMTKAAMYPIASIPFVRDVANGVVGGYGYSSSPVTSQIEQGLQGLGGVTNAVLADGEMTRGQIKAVSKLAGMAFGVPGTAQAWATGEHLYDVMVEGEELTTHQFLFGPTRK